MCPGPDYANYKYCLLTGATGTQPGSLLPNGVKVPLNFDDWTFFALQYLNSSTFSNFYGVLDAQGETLPRAVRRRYAALLEVPESITRSLTGFAPDGAPLERRRDEIARASSSGSVLSFDLKPAPYSGSPTSG